MDLKKRKSTRNKVWPETEVQVSCRNVSGANASALMRFKAGVENLGASGMFIKTEEVVVTGTFVELKIDFNPGARPPIFIHAEGHVVRTEEKGFAVKFSKIDAKALGECIMMKLNSK
jgi:hypothetical protein